MAGRNQVPRARPKPRTAKTPPPAPKTEAEQPPEIPGKRQKAAENYARSRIGREFSGDIPAEFVETFDRIHSMNPRPKPLPRTEPETKETPATPDDPPKKAQDFAGQHLPELDQQLEDLFDRQRTLEGVEAALDEADALVIAWHKTWTAPVVSENDAKTAVWFREHYHGKALKLARRARARIAEGNADLKLKPVPYTFGPGYRSVLWYGEPHSFTDTQAAIVELLAEAFEAGTPDLDAALLIGDAAFTQDKIKAKRGKTTAARRVRDLFRGSDAWGTMIVSGETKGTYRLNKPQQAGP